MELQEIHFWLSHKHINVREGLSKFTNESKTTFRHDYASNMIKIACSSTEILMSRNLLLSYLTSNDGLSSTAINKTFKVYFAL